MANHSCLVGPVGREFLSDLCGSTLRTVQGSCLKRPGGFHHAAGLPALRRAAGARRGSLCASGVRRSGAVLPTGAFPTARGGAEGGVSKSWQLREWGKGGGGREGKERGKREGKSRRGGKRGGGAEGGGGVFGRRFHRSDLGAAWNGLL